MPESNYQQLCLEALFGNLDSQCSTSTKHTNRCCSPWLVEQAHGIPLLQRLCLKALFGLPTSQCCCSSYPIDARCSAWHVVYSSLRPRHRRVGVGGVRTLLFSWCAQLKNRPPPACSVGTKVAHHGLLNRHVVYRSFGSALWRARNWHKKHSPVVLRTSHKYRKISDGCSSGCKAQAKTHRVYDEESPTT